MVRWVVGSTLHGVDPLSYFSLVLGARCSSVVRAFAHGAMGSSDRSFMDPLSYFSFWERDVAPW